MAASLARHRRPLGAILVIYGALLVSGQFSWLSRLSGWGLG